MISVPPKYLNGRVTDIDMTAAENCFLLQGAGDLLWSEPADENPAP